MIANTVPSLARLPVRDRVEIVGDALALHMRVADSGALNPFAAHLAETKMSLSVLSEVFENRGKMTPRGPGPVQAMTTSADFIDALTHAIKRVVADTATATPEHRQWCALLDLPDFRMADLPRVAGGDLIECPEGAEAEHVTVSVRGEEAKISNFAGVETITRQVVLNAEWDHVAAVARELVAGGFQTERTAVIALLNANADLKDGTAWFDATRSTDISSAALDAAAIGSMISTLRAIQTPSGAYLSLRPATLLVPSTSEFAAGTLIESAGKADEISVASDPRLTHVFLLPPAMKNPVIGVAHLRGERTPTTAVARRPRTDDYMIRAMLDFAAAPVSTHGVRLEITG